MKESVRTVGALLDLTVVSGRLDKIEELLRERLVGDGPGCRFSQLCYMDNSRMRNKSKYSPALVSSAIVRI